MRKVGNRLAWVVTARGIEVGRLSWLRAKRRGGERSTAQFSLKGAVLCFCGGVKNSKGASPSWGAAKSTDLQKVTKNRQAVNGFCLPKGSERPDPVSGIEDRSLQLPALRQKKSISTFTPGDNIAARPPPIRHNAPLPPPNRRSKAPPPATHLLPPPPHNRRGRRHPAASTTISNTTRPYHPTTRATRPAAAVLCVPHTLQEAGRICAQQARR